jgi:Domain of unknown function (DUF397)
VTSSDLAKPDNLRWRAPQSCNGGNCVRVAPGNQAIFIGDSKNPDGPILKYTRSEWDTFVSKIKLGYFDQL